MSLQKTYVKSKNCYKVTFSLSADQNPNKCDVRVLGDFNDWDEQAAPVMKLSKGVYKTSLEIPANCSCEFRYKLGEHDWANDENADGYVPSPHAHVDNCLLVLDEAPKTTKVKSPKKPKSSVSQKVNFTKIEGIGPKISQLLIDAGIGSYEELAKLKKKDIQSILDLAGKRYAMHDPSTWAKQSKLLAQGKTAELKELQKKLKGGKKS